MNKLIPINPADMRHSLAHPDKAFAVVAVTAEGNEYTFATIFKNKHGRTNLNRIGGFGRFLAGAKGFKRVADYAKHVAPDSTVQVFLDGGVVRVINRSAA